MTLQETTQLFGMELARQVIPLLIQMLFAVVIVPLVLRVRRYVEARLDAQTRQQVEAHITLLVRAAEQSGLKDALLQTGAAKKQYVIGRMQTWLADRGYNRISAAELSDLVEAAVLAEFNLLQAVKPGATDTFTRWIPVSSSDPMT